MLDQKNQWYFWSVELVSGLYENRRGGNRLSGWLDNQLRSAQLYRPWISWGPASGGIRHPDMVKALVLSMWRRTASKRFWDGRDYIEEVIVLVQGWKKTSDCLVRSVVRTPKEVRSRLISSAESYGKLPTEKMKKNHFRNPLGEYGDVSELLRSSMT